MADRRLVAGRFELLDVVGSGAFGVVWRSYDWKHRKLVAVKIFAAQGSEPELIHRFVQEQGFRLSHPNVLAPLDFFSDSERAALVMDLADGGSLEQLLSGGRPTLATAVAILEQLLDAVGYVHRQGIVHRDIKPANVLLDADDHGQLRVRLSDFGHTLPTGGPRLTAPTNVIGTPGYIAPELYRFEDASPRSDLYSIGALAYQLLTGNQPATPLDTLAATDPAIPEPLRPWLTTLTQPEPDQRPPTAERALAILRTATASFRVATPKAERRLTPAPRPKHQHRRRRRTLITTLAVLVAAGLITAQVNSDRVRSTALVSQGQLARLDAAATAEAGSNLNTALLLATWATTHSNRVDEKQALLTVLHGITKFEPRFIRFLATTGTRGDGSFQVSNGGRILLIAGQNATGARMLTLTDLYRRRPAIHLPDNALSATLSGDGSRVMVTTGSNLDPIQSFYDTSYNPASKTPLYTITPGTPSQLLTYDQRGTLAVFVDQRPGPVLRILNVNTGHPSFLSPPPGTNDFRAAAISADDSRLAVAATIARGKYKGHYEILQLHLDATGRTLHEGQATMQPQPNECMCSAHPELRYNNDDHQVDGGPDLTSIWPGAKDTSAIVWDAKGKQIDSIAAPPNDWMMIDIDRQLKRILAIRITAGTEHVVAVLTAETSAEEATDRNAKEKDMPALVTKLKGPQTVSPLSGFRARFVGANDEYVALVEQNAVALYSPDQTTPPPILVQRFDASPRDGSIYCVSPDGTVVATANGNQLRITPLGPGHSAKLLAPLSGAPEYLAISPDDQTIAVASSDHLELWDLSHAKPIKLATEPLRSPLLQPGPLTPSTPLSFSPDNKNVVLQLPINPNSLSNGEYIDVLDATSGQSRPQIGGKNDSERLVGFVGPSLVAFTNVNGRARLTLINLSSRVRTEVAFNPPGRISSASVNGTWLATSSSNSVVTIRSLINASDISHDVTLPNSTSTGLIALSPDGRTLANWDPESGLQLWDVTSSQELGDPIPIPNGLYPYGLSFTTSGNDVIILLAANPDSGSATNASVVYRAEASPAAWTYLAQQLTVGTLTTAELRQYEAVR